jgi:hypothetical protein
VKFGSWAEELCATILYKKPYITPDEMADCAQHIISSSDTTSDRVHPTVYKTFISIMSGNVMDAVELLRTMGGFTVAALPSTIVSSRIRG